MISKYRENFSIYSSHKIVLFNLADSIVPTDSFNYLNLDAIINQCKAVSLKKSTRFVSIYRISIYLLYLIGLIIVMADLYNLGFNAIIFK